MEKKQAVKAVSLLWLGAILGAGCAFVTQVILARELGPAELGIFAAALGMVTLVAPLASFGVGGFWLKIFGQEGWQGVRWLRGSLKYTLLATLLVLASLCAWATLGPHDEVTRGLLIVLSAYLLGQVAVDLVSAKLQLEERYLVLASWQFLPHFLRLLSVGILAMAVAKLMTLNSVAYAYALISIGVFIIGGVLLWRMFRGQLALKGHGKLNVNTSPSVPLSSMRQVAAQSWPFGLMGVFYLIYFQSDIILLKYITGDEAAGIYNVAFVIIAAVYILPSVIYQRFLLPKIHRWAEHDRERFYQVYCTGNRVMLVLGLLAMLAIWVLAPWGVPFMFGVEYQGSVSIVVVLGLAAPARFFASSAGAALSTQRHLVNKLYIMAMAAMINLVLNVFLIPVYGAVGAAVTTVATEVMIAFVMQLYARRYVFDDFNGRL